METTTNKRKRVNAGMSRAAYRAFALAANRSRAEKSVAALAAFLASGKFADRPDRLADLEKDLAAARAELARIEAAAK